MNYRTPSYEVQYMKNENSTIEEQLTPKGMFHSSAALKDKIMKEAQKENPIFTRNSYNEEEQLSERRR